MKYQNAIFFSLLAASINAAENYGMVTKLTGRAFGISDERTFTLKVGYKLPDETEIITEEGAQVSFMDYHDRQYHLSGAGHIKVTGHGLKLSRGYLWVQSFQKKRRLSMRTANALVETVSGEGVLSFDNASGKSQFLTIKGQFKFAHFLDPNRYEVLQPGEFSVVAPNDETPRRATPIGFESYEKVIALFRKPTPNRLPASNSLKAEFTPRQVASISSDLEDLHLGQLRKRKKKTIAKKLIPLNKVTTRIFGLQSLPIARRAPASSPQQHCEPLAKVETPPPPVLPVLPERELTVDEAIKPDLQKRAPATVEDPSWGFEQALRKHLRKTSRHKLEEDGLLDEIKNYREDYKINY